MDDSFEYFFWDTETTGLPQWKKPCAILELSIVHSSGRAFSSYINPGSRVGYEPRADEMHSASGAKDIAAGSQPFPVVWKSALQFVREQARGKPVVMIGYNIFTFDVKVLYMECVRYGEEVPSDWLYGDLFFHIPGARGAKPPFVFEREMRRAENRKLSSVYEAVFGAAFDNAHTAEADSRATMRLWQRAFVGTGANPVFRPWLLSAYLTSLNVPHAVSPHSVTIGYDIQPADWKYLVPLQREGNIGRRPIIELHDTAGARALACGPAMFPRPIQGTRHLLLHLANTIHTTRSSRDGSRADVESEGSVATGPGGGAGALPANVTRSSRATLQHFLDASPFDALQAITKTQEMQMAAADIKSVQDLLDMYTSAAVGRDKSRFQARLRGLGVQRIGEVTVNRLVSQLEAHLRAVQEGEVAVEVDSNSRTVTPATASAERRGGGEASASAATREGSAAQSEQAPTASETFKLKNGSSVHHAAHVTELHGCGAKTANILLLEGVRTVGQLRTFLSGPVCQGTVEGWRHFLQVTHRLLNLSDAHIQHMYDAVMSIGQVG